MYMNGGEFLFSILNTCHRTFETLPTNGKGNTALLISVRILKIKIKIFLSDGKLGRSMFVRHEP